MTTLGRKPKLTREQAERIVAELARGRTQTSIARDLGIARSTVRRYATGQCVNHRRHVA